MKKLFLSTAFVVFYTTNVWAAAPAATQDQIADAFEKTLVNQGIVTKDPIKIDETETGFKIVIPAAEFMYNPNGTNAPQLPSTTIELTRIDDFGQYAQYKMRDISMPYVKSLVSALAPNAKLTISKSTEEVTWVPSLNIRSKQDFKADDITLTMPENMTLKIASIVSNTLIKPNGNLMDSTGTGYVTNLILGNNSFEIRFPKITATSSIKGAKQIPDALQQALSAESMSSEILFPEIIASPALPPEAKNNGPTPVMFSTKLGIKTDFTQTKTRDMTVNMIIENTFLQDDMIRAFSPTFYPKNIKAHVSLVNINGNDVQKLMEMANKAADGSIDENSPEGQQMEEQGRQLASQLIEKGTIRFNELSAEDANARIHFKGDMRFVNQEPHLNGKLTITNFDMISPDYAKQCETQKRAQNPAISSMPNVCYQSGILDALRPYMATAQKGMDANRPTVTFDIAGDKNNLLINGQPFSPMAGMNNGGFDEAEDQGDDYESRPMIDAAPRTETTRTVPRNAMSSNGPTKIRSLTPPRQMVQED